MHTLRLIGARFLRVGFNGGRFLRVQLIGAGFLAAVAMAACSAKTPAPQVSAPTPVEAETPVISIQQEPVPIAQQMSGQIGVLRLEVSERGFLPAHLSAQAGSRVKIYLHNAGAKPHNLVIPRFGIVTSSIPPGGENYVEFTAGEKGAWPYFSDAPGAEEPGLAGILKVE